LKRNEPVLKNEDRLDNRSKTPSFIAEMKVFLRGRR
jgi:hypothetical protein